MLPIDLILVRHGQSEGNLAKRRSEAGDNGAFTDAFRERHSASFRLTELGRRQAAATGEWLRAEFYGVGGYGRSGFDRYLVSEYNRAKETAGLLGLPGATWYCDYNLTERDWGDLDVCPENEREEKFGDALRRRKNEPFFWRPPNGESFAQFCLRENRVLETLHRECSDKSVVIVCHGEVMRAFQVLIERMSQERFRELVFSPLHEDRIHNCQIVHYTRRNPATGRLGKYAGWTRSVRPSDDPAWGTAWREIIRPKYTNDDLLEMVAATQAMIS